MFVFLCLFVFFGFETITSPLIGWKAAWEGEYDSTHNLEGGIKNENEPKQAETELGQAKIMN